MRAGRLVLTAGLLAAAGCAGEVTGVSTVPAYVSWVEWPTAVTVARPGALRVSGYAVCPYQVTFAVTVSGADVRVTAIGRRPAEEGFCMDLRVGGSDAVRGAGYDTLLPLPPLTPSPSGLPMRFALSAPMLGLGSGSPDDQIIGGIDLRATEDTATQFAGSVLVMADSAGCWRLTPFARYPLPHWVLTKPPRLLSGSYGYQGYVVGRLVPANPPICGDSVALQAARLDVNVTPPWSVAPSRLSVGR